MQSALCVPALPSCRLSRRCPALHSSAADAGWSDFADSQCPSQANCSDCGVFTTQFAESLSRNSTFDFGQKNMPDVRRRLCYEIIAGQLLPLQ